MYSIFDHTGENVRELKDKLSWAVKNRDAAKSRNDTKMHSQYSATVEYYRQQLKEAKERHSMAIGA